MSNDISNNITNRISPNRISGHTLRPDSKAVSDSTCDNLDFSMDCLNAMGHAQVNMDKIQPSNSVTYATDVFKAHSDEVEMYNDFCDTLVEHGYSLEDAIEKTDMFFTCLKESETYRQ